MSRLPSEYTSNAKKAAYLASLSEDAFRKECVCPLFSRLGMKYYRDTCGVDEEGKDAIMIFDGPINEQLVYVIQTKRGKITMAASLNEDLLTALRQVRLAANTDVTFHNPKRIARPDAVFLVASGEINERARKHILTDAKDAKVKFYDVNDLIPLIDEHFAEFWHGVHPNKFPYLRGLVNDLLVRSDIYFVPNGDPSDGPTIPIADNVYVPLYLNRLRRQVRKVKGKFEDAVAFDEFETDRLLSLHEKLILVLGEGGSGKSTLLRRLAYEVCKRTLDLDERTPAKIPVLLRATELCNPEVDLLKVIHEKICSVSNNDTSFLKPTDLDEGALLLLVDALDEVATDASRRRIVDSLLALHAAHPTCTIILTSRETIGIRQLDELRRFAMYRVSPISVKQAGSIVNRIIAASKGELTDEKREEVEQNAIEVLRRLQDVHGIALSPFLVTIFVASENLERRDIPPNISEIFKKFTEQMLGRWDQRKGLAQQFEFQIKDYLVCLLAYAMHEQRRTEIKLSEARDAFAKQLAKTGNPDLVEPAIDEIIYRSGLFYVEGEMVGFRHQLFQEFFAGRGVSDQAILGPHLEDDWWMMPIMFYFGDDPRRHDGVFELTQYPVPKTDMGLFVSATTIGVAMQSAYFADEEKKAKTLDWVVANLAKGLHGLSMEVKQQQYPLTSFLYYYLIGREAVATELIRGVKRVVTRRKGVEADKALEPLDELHEFWRLVGLVESGCLAEAKEGIHAFRPDDVRLLLALHAGCYFVAHLRMSTKKNKKIARDILSELSPRVGGMAATALKEYSGMLLELRMGQVVAIDAPVASPGGQYELRF